MNHHGYTSQQLGEKVAEIEIVNAEAHQIDTAFEFDSEHQQEYDEIVEEKRRLSRQFVALEIGDKTITYRHTTLGLGSFLALMLFLVVIRYLIMFSRILVTFVVPAETRSTGMDVYAQKLNRIHRRRSRENAVMRV